MMKTRVCLGLALCAVLAGVTSGCSSTPLVARGQSPLPDPFVRPAGYGAQPDLHDAVHGGFHATKVDHYNVPMNDPYHPTPAHWHWSSHSGACPTGGSCTRNCPPDPGCPHCHGHPNGTEPCPFCQCEDPDDDGTGDPNCHWNHLHRPYPQHHFTYAYKRPHNLVYPPPQVPGGAVVYPYYTLKGPSDFFRR